MDLLLELDAPVEYIILTTHAYEHKVFVPSFQRRFPEAQVYYSPKYAPSPLPRSVQKEGNDTYPFIPCASCASQIHEEGHRDVQLGSQSAMRVPHHLLALRPAAKNASAYDRRAHGRPQWSAKASCGDTGFGTCRQWSFPLPLPLPLLGIFGAKKLPLSGGNLPWSDELEHACLAEFIGLAPYSEVSASSPGHLLLQPFSLHKSSCNYLAPVIYAIVSIAALCACQQGHMLLVMCANQPQGRMLAAQAVFHHKASRTLLVTDAAVYISSDPPEVLLLSRDIFCRCCMPCSWEACQDKTCYHKACSVWQKCKQETTV